MDLHFSSNKNRQAPKLNRKRLTQVQVRLLETCFNANQKLQVDSKLELARRLGITPRQVAVWYQNRRAREKVHTIELHHKTIKKELDNALAENIRLEQEVELLKHELTKTQQMLLASTSSPGNMTYSWEDAGLLPLEELYSCLIIGPQGQSEKQCRTDLSFQSVISS